MANYFWNGETQYTTQPSGSSWVYYLCVKEISTNQEDNTSYVGFGLGAYRGASQYDYIQNGKYKLDITASGVSGSSTSGRIDRAAHTGGFTPFTTLYLTVPHNDDGSLILNITTAYFTSVNGTAPPTASLSGLPKRLTMTTIPRNPLVLLKIAGSWARGKVRVKINGAWQNAKKIFVKINGVWKECALKG